MAAEVGVEAGTEVWVTCREEVWRPGVVVSTGDGCVVVEVRGPKGATEQLEVSTAPAPPDSPVATRTPRRAATTAFAGFPTAAQGNGSPTRGAAVGRLASFDGNSPTASAPLGGPPSPFNAGQRSFSSFGNGTGLAGNAAGASNAASAQLPLRLHKRNEALMTRQGVLAFEDLSKLPLLHEPAILHALEVRYEADVIYTQTGPMLLAVNPFKQLPDLYGVAKLRAFADLPAGADPPSPHIFSVARAAYQGIWQQGLHQTILVSGESGAGKTETTKFAMRFLALAGAGCSESCMSAVERQVLDSIPLLEALGNAKTLRNDNSSRFGKYIELQFRREAQAEGGRTMPRLVGALTHTYLLEKVRVTSQQGGERSFHIFYQTLAAAAAEEREGSPGQRMLDSAKGYSAKDFGYIRGSANVQPSSSEGSVDEGKCFEVTVSALASFGVSDEEAASLVQTIMAILHVGNIVFVAPPRNSEGSEPVREDQAGTSFMEACNLLGVQPEALTSALCMKKRQAPGEHVICSPVTCAKAVEGRDALARHLYGAIFAFVLERVNATVSVAAGPPGGGQFPFIGVLDIFGFEFFNTNSLEQLLINFTNELLQKHFNEIIFEHEAELYKREGIQWNPLDFPDNNSIVSLIGEVPGGILPMLEEECRTVGGNSDRWCSKMSKAHLSNRNFRVVRTRQECFIVEHFAGPVEYTSRNFFEKNLDALGADLVACMKDSSQAFIRQRFVEHDRTFGTQEAADTKLGTRKKAKAYSVSSEFRVQLKDLMDRIGMTQPHFVRCIKPNAQSRAGVFTRRSVVEQLQYQGVLQAIEVSRVGYPLRLRHRRSVLDFRCLVPPGSRRQLEAQIARSQFAAAAKILFGALGEHYALPQHSWAVGGTLVFFKRQGIEVLTKELSDLRRHRALRIQTWWRCCQARRRFLTLVAAAWKLQAAARGLAARRLAQGRREDRAALRMQSSWRSHLAQQQRRRRRWGLRVVQTWMAACMVRKAFLSKRDGASHLQRWWRQMLLRHRAARRRRCATQVQCLWRGRRGRLQVRDVQVAKQRRRHATRVLVRRWRAGVCTRLLALDDSPAAAVSARARNAATDSPGGLNGGGGGGGGGGGASSSVSSISGQDASREAPCGAAPSEGALDPDLAERLNNGSCGELLAAANALRSMVVGMEKEVLELKSQGEQLQSRVRLLQSWTLKGMLCRAASKVFGDACGGAEGA